jgi:hypothetical protein
MRATLPVLLLALAIAHPDAARAAWSEFADEKQIVALVHAEDGTPREITIWLTVVGDQGYIRTRNTSWRADLERDPAAVLRIAGVEFPIRVSAVMDPELYDRVSDAFTEKYGVTPHIFLSVARPFLGKYNVYRVDER